MAKKHTIELKMTLLEVIALLGFAGILASILLPMMPLSPTSSDETRANSDCIQIARAITAYKADYGTLPSTNTKAMPFSGAILKTLAGDNPRNKIYYTANENDCKNPWGFSYTIQFAKGTMMLSTVKPEIRSKHLSLFGQKQRKVSL